jgi:hypothetical protein
MVTRLPDPDLTPSATNHEGLRQLDPKRTMTAPGSATLPVPWNGTYVHDGDDYPITGDQAHLAGPDGAPAARPAGSGGWQMAGSGPDAGGWRQV